MRSNINSKNVEECLGHKIVDGAVIILKLYSFSSASWLKYQVELCYRRLNGWSRAKLLMKNVKLFWGKVCLGLPGEAWEPFVPRIALDYHRLDFSLREQIWVRTKTQLEFNESSTPTAFWPWSLIDMKRFRLIKVSWTLLLWLVTFVLNQWNNNFSCRLKGSGSTKVYLGLFNRSLQKLYQSGSKQIL